MSLALVSLPNPSLLFASGKNKGGAQDASYLRTILPSGSIVIVENMPTAKVLSVQLIASSRGVAENPQTHGWRHLLEHLVEKGPDKGLGARLESQGMTILSETHRDAMQFSIVVPPGSLEGALAALRDLLEPLRTTDVEVKREAEVVGEELALNPPSKRLSSLLWGQAYAESGLDPVGDFDTLSKATSAGLELLRRRHFVAQNLVVSVCGPNLDLDRATKQIRDLLPKQQDPVEPVGPTRTEAKAPAVRAEAMASEAVGAAMAGWTSPEAPATLAAALALAGEREGSFVIYTPSVLPGLAILGSDAAHSGLLAWLSARKPGENAALLARGRAFAKEWLQSQMASPMGRAGLRGLLAAQSRSATPEEFELAISTFKAEDFQAAMNRFVQAAGAGR